jgi:hypothetical protein
MKSDEQRVEADGKDLKMSSLTLHTNTSGTHKKGSCKRPLARTVHDKN